MFVYYATEHLARTRIVPPILPDGHVSQVPGVMPVPIWFKLVGLLIINGALPVVVLSSSILIGQASPAATIYLGVSFLVIGAFQAWFIVASIHRPVRALNREMGRVEENDLNARAPVLAADDVGLLSEGFNQMVRGLRQAEFVSETFGRYVSEEVRDQVLSGDITMDGEVRQVTVLFSDIRGFTAISEQLPPEELLRILNRYLDTMVEAIVANGGTIDKFIGDAVMANFGAPISRPDDPVRAVRAAWAMLERLALFNGEQLERGQPLLEIGIGLHTGPVVAGNLGSSRKMEYTVIGDTVNTASRIESLNKHFETKLLISAETHGLVKDHVEARPLAPINVKGKTAPVHVYEVTGLSPDFSPRLAHQIIAP